MAAEDNEEELLRSVALKNARSILRARQRAERELIDAKEALERKTADLVHSLSMMRATLESTTDGILVTNASGAVTDFNQNYIAMWRVPAEIVESGDHRQLLEITSRLFKKPEKFLSRIEEIYAISPPETFDLLELADGRLLERFSRIQFVERRDVGRVWSFRDITERQRAEEELRQQREWFEVTLSSIGDAVITTDTEGKVTFLNPMAEMLTGWETTEASGQPVQKVFNVINEDSREPAKNPVDVVLRDGIAIRLANHTALIAKDGTERSIEDSAAPIRDATGRISGAVMVFRDVTQRRLAEKTLQETDQKKDQFLAILAHELRNPLVPIRNGLQILNLAGNDPIIAENTRSIMDQALDQLVRLVDDLLDVSRITTGKLKLRKERVELAAVVQSAVEATRPLIEEQEQHLSVRLPPTSILLDADPIRLAQVFSNLLNNAAKYSEQGGHITLSAETDEDKVVVRVMDRGIGISADHLPRIFQLFAQVETASARSQGGLGIGLSLVRGLVEMHGGTIEARSEGPGRGSELIVRLPQAKSEALSVSQAEPDRPKRPPSPKYRILVVDDNRLSAQSTATALGLMGHDLATACDGIEGIARARTFRPDVILMDIGLPEMNGHETARRIREQPGGKNIILIAVTGYGQEEDRRRSFEAGFDYHLVKPLNFAELHSKLSEFHAAPRKPKSLLTNPIIESSS